MIVTCNIVIAGLFLCCIATVVSQESDIINPGGCWKFGKNGLELRLSFSSFLHSLIHTDIL
jgi:hypothetical protein